MDISFRAQCYLAAWDNQQPLSGGLAHGERLRQYNLDYSWDSLARIDAFLDALRAEFAPKAETFLNVRSQYNLLYLLAFYVGEVRARVAGVPARWGTFDELLKTNPSFQMFGKGFHSSAIQIQPGCFLPLSSIMTRLFDGPEQKSVQFSAGFEVDKLLPQSGPRDRPLPPVPPQSLVKDFPAVFTRWNTMERATYLDARWPAWIAQDPLDRLNRDMPALLRTGRMVLARVVQANTHLFNTGMVGAPLEVLYDPRGLAPQEVLHDMAKSLFELKSRPPTDPALQTYADHLKSERTRLFDWHMPATMLPYPLTASTTYMMREWLPGKRLALPLFPILVSDDCPGSVLIAPWQLWPADIFAPWAEALKSEHPNLMQQSADRPAAGSASATASKHAKDEAEKNTADSSTAQAKAEKVKATSKMIDDMIKANKTGNKHRGRQNRQQTTTNQKKDRSARHRWGGLFFFLLGLSCLKSGIYNPLVQMKVHAPSIKYWELSFYVLPMTISMGLYMLIRGRSFEHENEDSKWLLIACIPLLALGIWMRVWFGHQMDRYGFGDHYQVVQRGPDPEPFPEPVKVTLDNDRFNIVDAHQISHIILWENITEIRLTKIGGTYYQPGIPKWYWSITTEDGKSSLISLAAIDEAQMIQQVRQHSEPTAYIRDDPVQYAIAYHFDGPGSSSLIWSRPQRDQSVPASAETAGTPSTTTTDSNTESGETPGMPVEDVKQFLVAAIGKGAARGGMIFHSGKTLSPYFSVSHPVMIDVRRLNLLSHESCARLDVTLYQGGNLYTLPNGLVVQNPYLWKRSYQLNYCSSGEVPWEGRELQPDA